VLLTILRGLIFVKQNSRVFFTKTLSPFKVVGVFLVKSLGVPFYRSFFYFKRLLSQIFRPAKHRFLYLLSNKYSIHVTIVLLVVLVSFVNFSARDVRAETFGQQSILYALVAVDDSAALEIVEAGDTILTPGKTTSYLENTVVDARAHTDFNFLSESYVTPKTGTQLVDDGQVDPDTVPKRDTVETYVVKPGDSLGKISEKFGLSLSTLLWSNNLSSKSTIRPGDKLSILPIDGVYYTVKSGDTLSRIARTYNVTTKEIKEYNGIQSADTLSIGAKLLLPGGEAPSPTSSARSSATVSRLFTAPSKQAPAVGGWVWPTDWHVMTQYYGWRHTGIDVDGDYSTFSYAARDGVVIYSGWRTGYGITVEVNHGDGYVTRYAHHSKNFVSKGQTVTAGQALAQTGTTGRSTGTHLHFEIIKNGRFQNPLDYVR
jgi:murein DD-endopeptidase MepM/ murein hydrolase activator NlpD